MAISARRRYAVRMRLLHQRNLAVERLFRYGPNKGRSIRIPPALREKIDNAPPRAGAAGGRR